MLEDLQSRNVFLCFFVCILFYFVFDSTEISFSSLQTKQIFFVTSFLVDLVTMIVKIKSENSVKAYITRSVQ